MRRGVLTSALLLLTSPVVGAQPLTISAGVTASTNLGEGRVSPSVRLTTRTGETLSVETITRWSSADKKHGGWIFAEGVRVLMIGERRWGLLVGGDYRYRDGGPWVKHTVWSEAGVAHVTDVMDVRVLARAELYSSAINRVRVAQIEVRRRLAKDSRWQLEQTHGFVRYDNARWGYFLDASVGLVLGKDSAR